MKQTRDLSLESPFIDRLSFGVIKAITNPRLSLSWIIRGHLARDASIVHQTYWFTGSLPRVPLRSVLPGVEEVDIALPRVFDRKSGTSVNVDEACNLAAIAKWRNAAKVLEIGTYDGNSALVLAANIPAEGKVVTVDLPPDFDLAKQPSLTYTEGEFNLTPRDSLGRQYRGHPLSGRIKQVYGDSASLDWSSFGGPFDMVFIDGSHAEPYVRSDSQNALRHLSNDGLIVWHDYGLIPAVSIVVDEIARTNQTLKICAIEGTRLALGIAQSGSQT